MRRNDLILRNEGLSQCHFDRLNVCFEILVRHSMAFRDAKGNSRNVFNFKSFVILLPFVVGNAG
jgi:hypothetical protein